MRAFTRPAFRKALRHRLGAAVACLAYLLATLPLPLPASLHKDVSQPFPCQDHPCGCQTAEQCWRQCCCFTPEQRWAWARAQSVEPPAYAEKPAAPVNTVASLGWNTIKQRDRAEPAPPASCCKRGQARENCYRTSARSSCCKDTPNRPTTKPVKGTNLRWGAAIAAWQCRGLPTLWVSSGAVLPVPPPVSWSPDNPPPTPVALRDDAACEVPLDPPAPPPRLPVL